MVGLEAMGSAENVGNSADRPASFPANRVRLFLDLDLGLHNMIINMFRSLGM